MHAVFIQNKYARWYTTIIERARTREKPKGYVEKHHFIPLALGGDKKDIVVLTAKEHFIAHLLLVRMTTGEAKAKMCHGLWKMCVHSKLHNASRYIPSAKTFAIARELKAKATSDQHRGKTISPEHRARLSALRKGKPGSPHTPSSRAKMSQQHAGSSNPAAKRCVFQGIEYACIKDAEIATSLPRHRITRHPSFRRL